MDGPTIARLFVGLHSLTAASVIYSLLTSWRSLAWSRAPLLASSLLHLFLVYVELQRTDRRQLKLLVNYSVHVLSINFLFSIVLAPTMWYFSMFIASAYQVLNYYVCQVLPRKQKSSLDERLEGLWRRITNPPAAASTLAMTELMTAAGILQLRMPGSQKLFVFAVYIGWFVLFRYATDPVHGLIWQQWANSLRGLRNRTPRVVGDMIQLVMNVFNGLGQWAMSFYR